MQAEIAVLALTALDARGFLVQRGFLGIDRAEHTPETRSWLMYSALRVLMPRGCGLL